MTTSLTADYERTWSPWFPDTNPVNLSVLGKLAEELGEAVQMVARSVIQGITQSHPVTEVENREALEDEIADVRAVSRITIKHFALDEARIERRAAEKVSYLERWIASVRAKAEERRAPTLAEIADTIAKGSDETIAQISAMIVARNEALAA